MKKEEFIRKIKALALTERDLRQSNYPTTIDIRQIGSINKEISDLYDLHRQEIVNSVFIFRLFKYMNLSKSKVFWYLIGWLSCVLLGYVISYLTTQP